MQRKTEYISFGLMGVVLIALALWIQLSSMDMKTYSLSKYLYRDMQTREWWTAVGVPFVIGANFVSVSLWGIRSEVTGKISILVFACVAVLGGLVLFISPIAGLLASFTGIVCLVSMAIKY